MRQHRPAHDVLPFPLLKRQAIDWLELNRHRHTMHALLEADISKARPAIRAYRSSHKTQLSLTAYLLWCFARAVGEYPEIQAYRLGRGRIVHFAEVDVGVMVERDVEGGKMPVPTIIRAAQHLAPEQIEHQMRHAQSGDPGRIATGSLPALLQRLRVPGLVAWLTVPGVLRRLVWRWALHDPYRRKRLTGTVGLTAMSMYGHGTGWGVAPMSHTVTLLIGAVGRAPAITDGVLVERERVCLTLTFDHDVIDGAPAARFARRLLELIESGVGLSS